MSNILSFEEVEIISKKMLIEKYADLWRRAASQLRTAEEMERECKESLIKACDGQDFEGCGVKVEQIERKGSVEYKAIPELAEVNLEDYRKPSTVYWMVKPSVKE